MDVEVTEMDTARTVEPTTEEEAELKKAIEEMFAQMEQADIRIKRHQESIDRLKAETRAILAQIEAEWRA
jgi:hypothetical protein